MNIIIKLISNGCELATETAEVSENFNDTNDVNSAVIKFIKGGVIDVGDTITVAEIE